MMSPISLSSQSLGFPPAIRDYVLAVAETTQTSVDMAATAALAVLALCQQGNEDLAVRAQAGDEYAFEKLWKQTEGYSL